MHAHTSTILSNIDMFTGLSKKELASIERLMSMTSIKAGREFIKQGAAANQAFIVTSGEASVWRNGKLIATVGPGAVIGEMGLLAETPRSATVKAETDMTVEVLTRGEFSSLLDRSTKLTRKVLKATIRRLHELEPSVLG